MHTGENAEKKNRRDTTDKILRNFAETCPTNLKFAGHTLQKIPRKFCREIFDNIWRNFVETVPRKSRKKFSQRRNRENHKKFRRDEQKKIQENSPKLTGENC